VNCGVLWRSMVVVLRGSGFVVCGWFPSVSHFTLVSHVIDDRFYLSQPPRLISTVTCTPDPPITRPTGSADCLHFLASRTWADGATSSPSDIGLLSVLGHKFGNLHIRWGSISSMVSFLQSYRYPGTKYLAADTPSLGLELCNQC
jgi:hypothetical protein